MVSMNIQQRSKLEKGGAEANVYALLEVLLWKKIKHLLLLRVEELNFTNLFIYC